MEKTTNKPKKHGVKNPRRNLFAGRFLNTIISTIRPLQISKILDVGCGEGYVLDRLQKEKIGSDYEGIDTKESAITLGHELYPKLKLKISEISQLPYAENEFDLVICTTVLDQVDNPRKILKELTRVSKRYILLSAPVWKSPGFLKLAKVRGLKVVARKFPIPWTMLLLKKV